MIHPNKPLRDFDASHCSASLVRDVVALLHSRGRGATSEQVEEWACRMADKQRALARYNERCDEWLEAALNNKPIATMCLHLHFGDAL